MKKTVLTKLTRKEKKECRQERKLANKNYKVELKELQKRYKPNKFDRSFNKNARKIWMPYVKWDHNWDWTFITDILLYKIELVKLYIKHFSNTIDEERNRQIADMEEALRLYKVFQDTNFLEEEQAFAKEHTYHYIYFSEKAKALTRDYKYIIPTEKDDLIFYDIDCDLTKDKKALAEEYAIKAGVPKEVLYDDNLIRSFGAEWDSEENQKKAKELLKQAANNEQKALDKFFLYVSKHIREWWD